MRRDTYEALIELLDELRAREGAGSREHGGILSHVSRRENGGLVRIGPSALDQPQALFQLSGGASRDPRLVTVCLYRTNDSTPLNGANYKLQARIRWGVGKTILEALVDFHHGTRITLEASSCDVSAIYTRRDSSAAVAGPVVTCQAGVIEGNIGSRLNTLTLDTFSLLAATGTGNIAIPNYARRLSFQSTAPVAMTAQFFGDQQKAVADVSATLQSGAWIDIPNGMEGFQLDNPGPGNAVIIPVFELTL